MVVLTARTEPDDGEIVVDAAVVEDRAGEPDLAVGADRDCVCLGERHRGGRADRVHPLAGVAEALVGDQRW